MPTDIQTSFVDAEQENLPTSSAGVPVLLNAQELSAVEGWRSANNIQSTEQAMRELVRLGLLSEISGAYDVVASIRRAVDK